MITSRKNERLKDMRRLRRSKGDTAFLEGPHLVAEALACGLELETVLATPELLAGDEGRRLAALLPRPPLAVAAELLDEITDSDSPRGILASVRLPRAGAGALPLLDAGVYVYADGIQDPGNLGALGRVAEASGAVALATSPGSVHANHPRAQRAAAGSLLRLPVAVGSTPADVDARLAPLAPRWIALVPRGGCDLWTADLDGCLVLTLGAEGPGLSSPARDHADLEVTIPLAAPVESLNVTVAAALVLFEIRRRRAARP